VNILGCVTQEGIVNNGNCYLVLKARLELLRKPGQEAPLLQRRGSFLLSIFYIANMRDGGRRCGRLS